MHVDVRIDVDRYVHYYEYTYIYIYIYDAKYKESRETIKSKIVLTCKPFERVHTKQVIHSCIYFMH